MARTALPLVMLLAAICRGRAADGSFQRALVLDMAKVLLENYCFPENLLGMEEAIQQALTSGEILHMSDRKTLAGVLSTGVQGALNDPRLTVTFEPDYVPVTTPALSLLSREQLLRVVRSSCRLEVFDNGVGYLRIDRIIGRDTAAKIGHFLQESVWNRAARTKALILDLRFSVGGDLSGLPYVISFFSDAQPLTLIEAVYDRPTNTTRELWTLPRISGQRYGKHKDLMVLVSKRTSGAAEAVAYALKHLNRAIVIGERTSGGSGKIDKIQIGSSRFYITVPVARSISPLTGQSWELNGVSPSVSVRPKEALAKAKALLTAREAIPKAVRSVASLIQRYYASRDKVPALLSHLENTDFFTVISEDDLVAKLNYEIQSVCEDPRLIIKTSKTALVALEEPPESTAAQSDLDAQVEDVFKVEVRAGKSGYLRFDRFLDAASLRRLEDSMARKVWEPIKETDNLIIDLRSNTGGPSGGLPLLLSYLHDPQPPVLLYTLYDSVQNSTAEFRTSPAVQGPVYGSERNVYVLTGYHTTAAGEEFAYLMQSLRRGTVIGEITAGNLLHSRSFQVEGTSIVVTVPIINFIDNNGECWLGGGVVPDAIVLADEAEETAAEIAQFHGETRALVEGTGVLLGDHYALPLVASKVRGVLQAKWKDGSYRSAVDYESLASQLTSDLQETSGDHRLHVFYCDVEPEAMQETPKVPSSDTAAYIVDALFKIDLLPGNVGYLRADTMPDVEVLHAIGPQLLKQVWSKLVETEALVLDVRFNTGGSSSALPLLCSYVFGPEPARRHLYTVFDRASSATSHVSTLAQVRGPRYAAQKDVYVLTSHMTGSAAEAFAHTLKDHQRATLVGEPTVGGSLSSGMYQIGSSILYVSIPDQLVLSAVSGEPWSVSGVEPDVATQASEALNVAKRIIAAKQQRGAKQGARS